MALSNVSPMLVFARGFKTRRAEPGFKTSQFQKSSHDDAFSGVTEPRVGKTK